MENDLGLISDFLIKDLGLDPYGKDAKAINKFIDTSEHQVLCIMVMRQYQFQTPLVFRHILNITDVYDVISHENPEITKLISIHLETTKSGDDITRYQHESLRSAIALKRLIFEYNQKKKMKKIIGGLWTYIVSSISTPAPYIFAVAANYNADTDEYNCSLINVQKTLA